MRMCLPALCLVLSLSVAACDTTAPSHLLPPLTDFEVTFGTDYYDSGIALLETFGGQILVAGSGNGVIAPADGTLPTPSLTLLDASGKSVGLPNGQMGNSEVGHLNLGAGRRNALPRRQRKRRSEETGHQTAGEY